VVSERDLCRTNLGRQAVQHATAQPRAQRARRCLILQQILHDIADVGVDDPVLPTALCASARDEVVSIPVVPRVHGDRNERERNRCAPAKHVEDLQQRPAVFAA
jgi:hypothetical protein